MDTKTKLKYEKAKYTVKKWEKEFKNITSSTPTKADIKDAPSKIKEAYRTYYKLKTSVLESTLSDIIIDENAKDCFNLTNDASESVVLKSDDISLCEDSVCFQPLNETTFSQPLTDSLQLDALPEAPNTEDRETNSEKPLNFKNIIVHSETVDDNSSVEKENRAKNASGVWGQHLNKSNALPPSPKKNEQNSLSLQYAKKLFNPAKFKNFNKKNPRKPRVFQKSNTFDSLPRKDSQTMEIPKFEFFGSQENCQDTSSSQVKCVESPLEDDPIERLNEGIKVTTRTTTLSGNVTSLLQKTFESNDRRSTMIRDIDSAWLGRVQSVGDSKKNESMSQDSGVELSQGLSASQLGSDSDSEDLIYDSDSESQTASRSLASFAKLSNSSTVMNSSQSMTTCTLPLLNIRKSTPSVTLTLPHGLEGGISIKPNLTDNQCSKKDAEFLPGQLFDNSSLTDRPAKRPLENKMSPPSKKLKTDPSSVVESCAGTLPEIVAASKKSVSRVSNKSKASNAETDKKFAQLEKMLQSGKANENFVAINLEKKVFARGKKRGTFSKYKKQKWRALKQENGSYSGPKGVLKCFKCGDVGHFSKACTSDKGLLPIEDYISDDDESVFSTLEEAAEAAREAGSAVHAGKRKFTQPVSADEILMPVVEEVDRIGTLGSVIQPPYLMDEFGNPPSSTPKEVFDCLKSEFGFDKFLDGQESAVMRVLSGKSTLVTLSTGSGKSLCYQLPAAIYSKYNPGCITLVVSPLVSLMEDQVVGASGWEKSACYHTFMTQKKRDKVIERLKAKELSVLLLSPEALVSLEAGAGKQLLSALPNIAFACIDEAHCLHQWCHNFRPSYLTVAQVLRERFGVRTLLGLTATASIGAIESLRTHLGIDDTDRDALITDTPMPDNLILSVSVTRQDSEKLEALKSLLSVGYLADCSSIIIYCIRRETCDRVASFLRSSFQENAGKNKVGRISMEAEVYHAGLTAGRRNQVQKAFMSGKLRIVVATVAFGMGINKPDIRGVIHFSLPSTFENYVQEVGRAGRDRMPARCHLLLDSQNADLGELRRHIYGDTMDRFVIRKLLQLVFIRCDCEEGTVCPKHEVAFPIESTVAALDLPQESISTLLAYLELDKRKWIKVLPLAYTKCKISSYRGPNHLKMICKSCPPLALVLTEHQEKSKKPEALLEFDLFELARKINWDSGVLKNTLKKLEWTTVNDKPQKSGIVVEFLCLGFRVLAPGNLPGEELDYALDVLNGIVQQHEKTKLKGLQAFYNALSKISYDSIEKCNKEEEMTQRSNILKAEIREYFNGQRTVDSCTLPEAIIINEKSIIDDIRQLIVSSKDDHVLTGRAIARIFHGIGSPNFAPIIWGRTRYWRQHMNQDFNALCKLATQQLLLYR